MTDRVYALHDLITGKSTEITNRKMWWMKKLAGPDRQTYSRMLFDLPPLEN